VTNKKKNNKKKYDQNRLATGACAAPSTKMFAIERMLFNATVKPHPERTSIRIKVLFVPGKFV